MKNSYALIFLLIALLNPATTQAQTEIFNYKKALTSSSRTLSVNIQAINRSTGDVTFGGGDSRGPSTPNLTFTWIWGDGTSNNGFFPQSKKYTDLSKNYIAKVISSYSSTEKDTVEILVEFAKGKVSPIALDPKLKVSIPTEKFTFTNYNSNAIPFSNTIFDKEAREQLEYLLHVGATVEYDFVNQDATLFNGKFEQYMLRDSLVPGAYSLWFTKPVGFGAGDVLTKGTIDYSSLHHEMGHNFTLNSPASYNLGNLFGGNAQSFFTESLAQVFQYAAGYEVINNYKQYGLDEILLFKYKDNFFGGVSRLRGSFDEYVNGGRRFATWSKVPGYSYTDSKDAFLTFLTIPYKFCEYAEKQGAGYRIPVKRMMQFLQRVSPEWQKRYEGTADTPTGNAFRATMMVAAMSHAFQKDLRADFRLLNYPISDTDWAFLNPETLDISVATLNIAANVSNNTTFAITSNVAWTAASTDAWLSVTPASGAGNQTVTISALANTSVNSRTGVVTILTTGGSARTVNITQAGVSPTLSLSVKTLNLNYSEGSTAAFDITSNLAWTAASSQTWLSLNPASGSQNGKVTIAASVNPLFESRKASVTVKAAGLPDQVIEVTQASPPVTGLANLNKTEVTVFPNPVSNLLQFKGLSGKGSVRIYSQNGRLQREVITDHSTQEISLADLPQGLYLLQITTSAYSGVMKIIKM